MTVLVFSEVIKDDGGKPHTAYGIQSYGGMKVRDITTNGEAIKRLAAEINESDIEEVHLFDVIEDFIFEETLVCIQKRSVHTPTAESLTRTGRFFEE